MVNFRFVASSVADGGDIVVFVMLLLLLRLLCCFYFLWVNILRAIFPLNGNSLFSLSLSLYSLTHIIMCFSFCLQAKYPEKQLLYLLHIQND